MYYLNRDEFAEQITFLQSLHELLLSTVGSVHHSLQNERLTVAGFAQERLFHLLMECVTDIGHMMIDAFMMRDAGSYEDIIVILHEENVIADECKNVLIQLVQLKSPLLKTYRQRLSLDDAFVARLCVQIPLFISASESFVKTQFGHIGG